MDDVAPLPPNRSKLLGWLILVAFLVVLAGLLLPLFDQSKKMMPNTQCGRNQSQIMGAFIAFTAEGDPQTWIPSTLRLEINSMDPARGRLLTATLFERLAATQSLENSLFRCPAGPAIGPSGAMKPSPDDFGSAWRSAAVAYAFDWAAPIQPGAGRIMIADRNPDAHDGLVMVVFGDTHVNRVKVIAEAGDVPRKHVTEGVDGQPISVSAVNPPDDDIFTSTGDAGDPLTPGEGDPLRAWVK